MPTDSAALTAIVLAAGQGTRMRSALPKPLHPVCGRSMLAHVLAALDEVAPDRVIVVVGRDAEAVTASIRATPTPFPVAFAEQHEQLGTGHAVRIALDSIGDRDTQVVVLPGDAPLLRASTLRRLVESHRSRARAGTVLTARVADPTGYGRILRGDDGRVVGIVEQADATDDQVAIDEVNTSMYCFDRDALDGALGRIGTDNAQGEWYLTDVIGVLADSGAPVGAWVMDDPAEAQGVNDRVQLAAAARVLQARINDAWMRQGVTMLDPAGTHVEVDVQLAVDVTLHPGAVLRGRTSVGEGTVIGPNVCVEDATIGPDVHLGASCVIGPGVHLAAGRRVPPLTRLGGDAERAGG